MPRERAITGLSARSWRLREVIIRSLGKGSILRELMNRQGTDPRFPPGDPAFVPWFKQAGLVETTQRDLDFGATGRACENPRAADGAEQPFVIRRTVPTARLARDLHPLRVIDREGIEGGGVGLAACQAMAQPDPQRHPKRDKAHGTTGATALEPVHLQESILVRSALE